jgi:hypothetical protein
VLKENEALRRKKPMSLLPIVLFILGVLVFIWAWKMGNSSSSTSPEIIATLKGLAGVKRELSQVQREIRDTEARMEDHELRILRNENTQAEIQSIIQTRSLKTGSESNLGANHYEDPNLNFSTSLGNSISTDNNLFQQFEVMENPKPQVLPEKYRWVLELHTYGWSVAEIAGHLAISQDAVNMVLRTSEKGGHS